LGRFIAPEGLQDSAQGFNPGNRPPGRRALKGRQIRRIRNRRKEHIYLGAAIAPLCAGAHYFSHREIVSLLTNTLFLFGSNRTHLAHVISRPFRANRFFGCFPGLKPWAESYSPCGAKNIPNGLILVPFLTDPFLTRNENCSLFQRKASVCIGLLRNGV
jgi:hypothetical protein